NTLAVILEPVQGEGGVRPVSERYMKRVRELCDKHDILMILDEIQSGIGRTGKMFAYQHYGIKPDIVASAKALGNGFPIGAVIAKKEAGDVFEHGNHGTTYGGNPLACAAANAVLSVMQDEGIPEKAAQSGAYFMSRLNDLAEELDCIKNVRGKGLMIGVEISLDGRLVVEGMMRRGVLSNFVSGDIIRFVPPLIITRGQIDRVVDVLAEACREQMGTANE
ncbi:MAG TPA: aminotransferase class III-fold pyridoxal phosphate-dependent enzyme, partial [Balneolaceae bacterium]|nr:aminotransferase class III-fold pyridoxal phosphate-dependent enzyme [Balneolaceae bacterium]